MYWMYYCQAKSVFIHEWKWFIKSMKGNDLLKVLLCLTKIYTFMSYTFYFEFIKSHFTNGLHYDFKLFPSLKEFRLRTFYVFKLRVIWSCSKGEWFQLTLHHLLGLSKWSGWEVTPTSAKTINNFAQQIRDNGQALGLQSLLGKWENI